MPQKWIAVIDSYGHDEDELRKLDELLDGAKSGHTKNKSSR